MDIIIILVVVVATLGAGLAAFTFRVGCLTSTSRTPCAARLGRWRGSSRCCSRW